MERLKKFQKVILILLIIILGIISCNVYAIEKVNTNEETQNLKSKKQKINIYSPIEQETLCTEKEIPNISTKSKQLLNSFNKDISNVKEVKKVYDNVLNRETIRIISADTEIDLDNKGNIVSYKNLDDFSTVDKDKRDYNENEYETNAMNINYKITKQSDLNNIISLIETENDLNGYKIVDCSNEVQGTWVLTWCKDYGNDLINLYDCVNVVVDAKDGSVMLFGKNKIEPNTTTPSITMEDAINLAQPIISKLSNDSNEIHAKLSFFRPNYYWEEGGPFESSDSVCLTWEVIVNNSITIQIDAITGENVGGDIVKGTDCARAMGVVPFPNQDELTRLASQAFTRLGYNQNNYSPVTWAINQADINWMLNRPDVYGLYLSCHGGMKDGLNFLTDSSNLNTSTWQVWSNNSFGNWHFVYLDACLTSSTKNFPNAFGISGSGKCFVGWNISIATDTATDFNRRFLPRLGTMSVYNAVVTSLWESRNAGYNSGNRTCNPGFTGDSNYYGWAW